MSKEHRLRRVNCKVTNRDASFTQFAQIDDENMSMMQQVTRGGGGEFYASILVSRLTVSWFESSFWQPWLWLPSGNRSSMIQKRRTMSGKVKTYKVPSIVKTLRLRWEFLFDHASYLDQLESIQSTNYLRHYAFWAFFPFFFIKEIRNNNFFWMKEGGVSWLIETPVFRKRWEVLENAWLQDKKYCKFEHPQFSPWTFCRYFLRLLKNLQNTV